MKGEFKKQEKSELSTLLFVVAFMTLFIAIKRVTAADILSFETTEVPLFIRIFMLIMLFQTFLTYILIFEVKSVSHSKVWNSLSIGNFFCIMIILTQAILMYKLYEITTSIYVILILFILFYVATHFFVNISLYSIIKPLKKKINLFKAKYLTIYFFPIFIYLSSDKLFEITFPICSNFIPLYSFAAFFSVFAVYFAYHLFLISRSYREVGFVHKPYILGGFGALALIISALIVFTCVFMYIEPFAQPSVPTT
ncbi:hypothetical protein ES705_06339 [subsurface metagenome]|nr:hypothetical protein [Methanosarcinales archaeon]